MCRIHDCKHISRLSLTCPQSNVSPTAQRQSYEKARTVDAPEEMAQMGLRLITSCMFNSNKSRTTKNRMKNDNRFFDASDKRIAIKKGKSQEKQSREATATRALQQPEEPRASQ